MSGQIIDLESARQKRQDVAAWEHLMDGGMDLLVQQVVVLRRLGLNRSDIHRLFKAVAVAVARDKDFDLDDDPDDDGSAA